MSANDDDLEHTIMNPSRHTIFHNGWWLSADSINDLQQASVDRQIRRCKVAHHTDLDVRINGKNESHEADWVKHMVRVDLTSEAGAVGHAAVEAECVHMALDARRVTRIDASGNVLSLWGRIERYIHQLGPSQAQFSPAANAESAERQQ